MAGSGLPHTGATCQLPAVLPPAPMSLQPPAAAASVPLVCSVQITSHCLPTSFGFPPVYHSYFQSHKTDHVTSLLNPSVASHCLLVSILLQLAPKALRDPSPLPCPLLPHMRPALAILPPFHKWEKLFYSPTPMSLFMVCLPPGAPFLFVTPEIFNSSFQMQPTQEPPPPGSPQGHSG